MEENSTEYLNARDLPVSLHPMLMLRDLVLRSPMIIVLTIAAGIWAFIIMSFLYVPKYETNTTFVVSVSDGSTSVYSNLNAASDLAGAFSEILNSDIMKKTVMNELGYESFDGTIQASVIKETNLMEMRIVSTTPQKTFLITKSVLNNYEALGGKILKNLSLDILKAPTVPTTPINYAQSSHYAKLAALVTAVGLSALICALFFLRDTIKSIDEVEEKLDTKLLAYVAHEEKDKSLKEAAKKRFRKNRSSILITNPTTSFEFVETFKKLRTRVEYMMRRSKYKTVMITSVMENEGKSTVAVNMALAMNRRKKSVLIIDADMKKPAVHKILGYQDAEYGTIIDYLDGKATLRETVLKDKNRKIGLILGKRGTERSTELARCDDMKRLIDEAREKYDLVILDTPPMSVSPDAECIADFVDCAILVVQQDGTSATVINDAIDTIGTTNAKLLGCVLNNVRRADVSDNYSFGSSGKYGYSYGYGRYDRYHSYNNKYGEGRYSRGSYGSYGGSGYGGYGKYGKYGNYGKYGYDKYSHGYGNYRSEYSESIEGTMKTEAQMEDEGDNAE